MFQTSWLHLQGQSKPSKKPTRNYSLRLTSVLFADDTSFIISDKDPTNFKIKINKLFDITNEWFATNQLTINYEKPVSYSFKQKIAKRWIFRSVI
jgi:hypothetical protein